MFGIFDGAGLFNSRRGFGPLGRDEEDVRGFRQYPSDLFGPLPFKRPGAPQPSLPQAPGPAFASPQMRILGPDTTKKGILFGPQ